MRWALGLLTAWACTATAAVDLQALWDFARPEVSEARFRAQLDGASPDDAVILRTQIARCQGLRRQFDAARAELAALAPGLDDRSAEAQVRYHLELGRTWASATHRDDELTPAARTKARNAFVEAHRIARRAGLDGLAVDALHMLPFAEAEPELALRWNRQALELALGSAQDGARRWEGTLRHNLGLALHQLGRYDEALEMFRAGRAYHARSGNVVRERVARWTIAWTLRAQGRLDEATEMQLALARENELAGTPDRHVFEELAALDRARERPSADRSALPRPEARFRDAAVALRRQAEARGDQPYGAVLVQGGRIVGEGPSRVVERGDPLAHAEREAIRDAQRRLGTRSLPGTVLYSTSRPCTACEDAAAEAGVARMIHGPDLVDAGAPRRRSPP